MPHPRDRPYDPITGQWIADEIDKVGDLDGARAVWRRFTNRLAQTGEATSLDGYWRAAVTALGKRGRADLAEVAQQARQLERQAPRKRAPKTFRRVTDESIAGAVIQAGSLEEIRRVWLRYRRNLGEAHQGDITERWPFVLGVLRRLGRADLVTLAGEAQRLELQAQEKNLRRWREGRARRELEARHAEGRTVRGRRRVGGLPATGAGKTPQVKAFGDFKVAIPEEMRAALDRAAKDGGVSRQALISQYLLAGTVPPVSLRDAVRHESSRSGQSEAEVVRRMLRAGLARGGFEVLQDA